MTIVRLLLSLIKRATTFPYRLARRKISVQLVYSHVLVVILTVIVIEAVGFALLMGLFRWTSWNFNDPNWSLGNDSQIVGVMLGGDPAFQTAGAALTDDDRQRIAARLATLVSAPELETIRVTVPAVATDIDQIAVTNIDGQVLISTDPAWAMVGTQIDAINSPVTASLTRRHRPAWRRD